MSMIGSAGASSASAAFMRGASSNAAEAAMNWRRDKVTRAGACMVRDLRIEVWRGFADCSNMKCGAERSGTGVSPVSRLHDLHRRDARATTLETPGLRNFVCFSTYRPCEWLNTDPEKSAGETPAAPWILCLRTL